MSGEKVKCSCGHGELDHFDGGRAGCSVCECGVFDVTPFDAQHQGEGRVERLEAALQNIEGEAHLGQLEDCRPPLEALREIQKEARQALNPKEEE